MQALCMEIIKSAVKGKSNGKTGERLSSSNQWWDEAC